MEGYYLAAREAAQRDMQQLVAQNARLKQRQAQLEQLVKDGLILLDGRTGIWTAWQDRARALLEQEVK